jgi:hypothetical protein
MNPKTFSKIAGQGKGHLPTSSAPHPQQQNLLVYKEQLTHPCVEALSSFPLAARHSVGCSCHLPDSAPPDAHDARGPHLS